MNTTNFLEQLAKEVHYSSRVKELITAQSNEVQKAVDISSSTLIHNQFGNVGYLANGTGCVELMNAKG